MKPALFSPLLPLFAGGKALTYNEVLKAWPSSPHYAQWGRAYASRAEGLSLYDELKALVTRGVLVEGKRRGWGTWKLAKGAQA